jgi:hypothetical protein
MMPCKTEVLYPSFGIAQLRNSSGSRFRELVDRVASCSAFDPVAMAFTLMIRRLRGLAPESAHLCHDPSCALCAASLVTQYPGDEDSLLETYHQARCEIEFCLGVREKASVA